MRQRDPKPEDLKALRDEPLRDQTRRERPLPRGGLSALLRHQDWMWRKAGLVLALVLAVVIAGLTLTPSAGPPMMPGIDKVYHAIAFAALIFPLIVTDSRRWFWAVPLAIAYGGVIELIQPTVGRSAEWLDFGADISGVLAGAALAELLHDRIRRSVFDLDGDLDLASGSHLDGTEDEAEIAQREAARTEAMRSALMADLRAVLREELASVRRPGDAETAGDTESAGDEAVAEDAGPDTAGPDTEDQDTAQVPRPRAEQ